MRCFLAIELPEEAKKELSRIQKEIAGSNVKMKLVEKENLHLTLKFFGEVSDYQVNKIKELLKQVRFEKFQANLGISGVFPSSSFIRVVWVSLEPSEKVKELHGKIDEMLEKEKFRKDKVFESHVTLARVKFVKDKQQIMNKLKEIKVKPMKFQISSFVLKKSTLTEKGPVYGDVAKFDLT
jgi:2'-5' RNA ligase